MRLRDLPTLAQVEASRRGKPLLKGPSRLEKTTVEDKRTLVDEATFKREVRERDQWQCRRCHRKVVPVIPRQPDRAEVHHIHGRGGDLRFESRCALLLCLGCHEKVTGRVNDRWVVVATKTFTMRSLPGKELTDARAKVTFERVA